jgi:hypothetical protein
MMVFLVQLDDIFYFDTFTHTLHVSGIYHPSSGATTANWSGWYNNLWVLRPVGCYSRLVLFIALCDVDITQCDEQDVVWFLLGDSPVSVF